MIIGAAYVLVVRGVTGWMKKWRDHELTWRYLVVWDDGILCEKASGDSAEVAEDLKGVRAIG